MRTPAFASCRRSGQRLALLFAACVPAATSAQTVATAASPSSVRLEAGAKTIEVRLTGRGLDRVREAQVTSRGRVVGGVTSRIVKAGSGELVLALSADAGTKAARGLRILLIAPRGTVQAPLDVEVAAAAVVFEPEPRPALAGLSAAPATLTPQASAAVEVTLDRAAPAGGLAVALTADGGDALILPAQLVVPGGPGAGA